MLIIGQNWNQGLNEFSSIGMFCDWSKSTKEDNRLPAAAAGNPFPYKIKRLRYRNDAIRIEKSLNDSIFSKSLRYRSHHGCGCRRYREKWFPFNFKWLRHAGGNGSGKAMAYYGTLRLYGNQALASSVQNL